VYRLTRSHAIITAVIMILAAPSFSKEKGDGFIWVGVMRNDGILIPVGLYQAGKWNSPWTDEWDSSRIELEDDTRQEKHRKKLSEIPSKWLGRTSKMPTKWFLLSKDGKSVPFNVLEAVKYTSHCIDMWGLKTDYKSGIKDSSKYRWPKPTVGIAVSSRVRFLQIEDMGKAIPKGLDIRSLLKPEFEKQEEIIIEEFLKKVPSSKSCQDSATQMSYRGTRIGSDEDVWPQDPGGLRPLQYRLRGRPPGSGGQDRGRKVRKSTSHFRTSFEIDPQVKKAPA